jgi:hypothetical protein
LTEVNIIGGGSSTSANILDGNVIGQTAYWNSTQWVPTSDIKYLNNGISINTAVNVKVRDVSTLTASSIVMDQNEYILLIDSTTILLGIVVLPSNPGDGRKVIIKKVDTTGDPISIWPGGNYTIDGAVIYNFTGTKTSITLIYCSTLNDWLIV